MTDPLDALYSPATPAHPDREFADRLRNRLRAKVFSTPVFDTTGGTVTTDALTPYLAVRDATAALRWYRDVLDAVPDGEQYVMDDGRIGHAELLVQGARLMLADEFPEYGHHGPRQGDRFFVSLSLQVPDTDAQFRRAVEAGATAEREPGDNPYGRIAVVIDPFGHRWMFHGPNVG